MFDFTVDRLPNQPVLPVSIVDNVLRRIRNQDWSDLFVYLFLILVPSGLVVFLARDRYYRRRGVKSIQLKLKTRD